MLNKRKKEMTKYWSLYIEKRVNKIKKVANIYKKRINTINKVF